MCTIYMYIYIYIYTCVCVCGVYTCVCGVYTCEWCIYTYIFFSNIIFILAGMCGWSNLQLGGTTLQFDVSRNILPKNRGCLMARN